MYDCPARDVLMHNYFILMGSGPQQDQFVLVKLLSHGPRYDHTRLSQSAF